MQLRVCSVTDTATVSVTMLTVLASMLLWNLALNSY